MHIEVPNIDLQAALNAKPINMGEAVRSIALLFVSIGVVVFFWALFSSYPDKLLWGTYFVSLLFWMGLSVGMVMTTAIFQIVRALWAVPIRRVAEAHISFLPWAFALWAMTYFGKEHLYPWANAPMPGREYWMEPNFVYLRFGILFFGFFALLRYFTRLSLRSDVGVAREHAEDKDRWQGLVYKYLTKDWKGEPEIRSLQVRMSYLAPVLVVCYAVLWTLFATEMICGMDTIWFSNMFGGFEFLANIYTAWAMLAVLSCYIAGRHTEFGRNLKHRQLWDLGMLTFGFCMLFGYTFFSQFLPQWYGNMPEETQWMMLRTRELPWKSLGYVCFACAFILPFVLLLSRDIKRNPRTFTVVACIIFLGIWLEKYMVVMPQLSPDAIPFGFVDIGIFLGFFGLYLLSISKFLRTYPFMTFSHPQARGDVKSW
ncbi:MAG: hypothetical protein KDD70_18580 [Bdellovibrionales bacterium]|nr:hypothetical protein [Bdellovibrionales bacterium]